jgi:Tol biopolymer transport system component
MSEPNLNPELEQKVREALSAPAPDAAFANRLRATLIVKAAGMKPEPRSKRFLWRFGFATLVLALLAVFLGPKIVTAMKQLFGYVPGAGLVDQSVPLRVLAEPVTVTRDGVTLTVESAVLSADKTVVSYALKDVPWEALSHQEDVPGCMGFATLRLPDGTMLEPGEGGGTMNKISFTYPTIPADVNDATFVLPCIQGTLPGKAPENWELTLRFMPAPPDFEIAPVVDVPTPSAAPAGTQTSLPATPENPVKLVKVVDLPDGYIFAGTFHAVDLPQGADSMWPSGLYSVTDANGQEIYASESYEQILPPPGDPTVFNWAVEIKGKQFAFPLTIAINGAEASATAAAASFEFDASENPQMDQVFSPNTRFEFNGYPVTLDSVRFTGTGYDFNFTTNPLVSGLGLEIDGFTANGGGGGNDGEGHISAGVEFEGQVPKGRFTVLLKGLAFHVPGPWTVQWQPENAPTGASSPYGIALTIDKYIPLEDGYYLIGHTAWADERISRVSLGDWTTKAFDAAGREIPLEPASASDAGIDISDPNQWVFKIYGKAFNGPVTLKASQVTLWFASAPSVEIDLKQYGFTGGDDQLGYAWKVGMLPLDLPGLTAKVQSLAFQRERDLKGFTVYIQADPSIVSLPLDIFPMPAGGQRGSGGSSIDADGRLFSSFFSDGTISCQFKLIANSANITGNWSVEWTPPVVDAAAVPDSPSPACLDLAGWKQAALSPASAPGIGGTLAVYGRILDDNQPPSPENYGILLTSLDGSQQKTFGQGVNPSLSADGARLAYNWQDGLHVVDTATGKDTVLTGLNMDDFGPKLSPDGAQLVFVRPADMNLYLVNADGSNLRQFTDTPASEEYAHGWTADGGSVIYLKIESGQPSLVAKNVSTGQESTLFIFPASVGAFSLSPDARTLAYTAPVRGRMAGGIYTIPMDGSSAPKLLIQLDHWTADFPLWSPDGRWLLFNLYNADSYAPAANFSLLNVSTCQVMPLNGFEGMAQSWIK